MDVQPDDLKQQTDIVQMVRNSPHLMLVWNRSRQRIQVRARPTHVPAAPAGFEWPPEAA